MLDSKGRIPMVDLLPVARLVAKEEWQRALASGEPEGKDVDDWTSQPHFDRCRILLSQRDPSYSALHDDTIRRQIVKRVRKRGWLYDYDDPYWASIGKTRPPKPNRRSMPKAHSEDYEAYLRSPHWQRIRRLAMAHFKGRCALNWDHVADDTHHRRYKDENGEWVLGREEIPDDAVCLCRSCHETHHASMPDAPKTIPVEVKALSILNEDHLVEAQFELIS